MVKSRRFRKVVRPGSRGCLRRFARRTWRPSIRNLPGFHAGRHDLSQALVAFRRAIRAHRRLAKLHPEQFDATESERFRRRRESDREWLAMWEPALHEIYGSSPDDKPPNPLDDLPPEPKSSRTRQAIDREFAKLRFWMEVGSKAFKRYNQRGSRALISLGQVVRILEIGFDFARLVVPDDISDEEFSHAQALADLERAYGRPLPGEDEETFSGAAPVPVAPATPPHEPLP